LNSGTAGRREIAAWSRKLAGTFARIEAVLRADEDRTDFVREAVEQELARREKKTARR
jgi:hypothetical protein